MQRGSSTWLVRGQEGEKHSPPSRRPALVIWLVIPFEFQFSSQATPALQPKGRIITVQKPSQSWPCPERWSGFVQVKVTSESLFLSWPLQLWNLIGGPVVITPFICRIESACLFPLFLFSVNLFVVSGIKLLVRSIQWSSEAIQLSRIITFEGPTESTLLK